MPLHLPHIGKHKDHKDHHKQESHSAHVSTSPTSHSRQSSLQIRTDPTNVGEPPRLGHHDSSSTYNSASTSSPATDLSRPTSILRRPEHADSPGISVSSPSDYTQSSSSASAFMSKRLSGIQLDRWSTRDSSMSEYDGPSTPTTPATSVSSLDNNCPLPQSTKTSPFPFFTMTLSSTSTISFIALPLRLRPIVLDAITQAWKKGFSKVGEVDYLPDVIRKARERGDNRCEGGVWEVTMKETPWLPSSTDKVSSRRIMINLLTEFAREGYSLVSSYRTSAKNSSKDTLTFMQGAPDPDPIFMAVAFHSHDRIWIIDAEAEIGEAVEEGIKQFWDKGIRDARVRERHCRELRLRGDPWTSHHTNSLISSRIIHLVILKSITHTNQGYDFVGSVNMSDAEETEMPVTFFRRQWGPERAVWNMKEVP